MLQHPFRLLLLACLPLVLVPFARDAEDDAWKAAAALKARGANLEAAAAFEKIGRDFPQSPKALLSSVEAGVCWFTAGRSAQILQRMTPEALARFDKSMSLLRKVTSEHPSAPEASRACYVQGSVHLFSGDLEAAETDYSNVLEKFPGDRVYFGKALDQRANVRRHLLRTQDAVADLGRWIKEIGAPPDMLAKMKTQLARAQMLDKPAPAYKGELWYSGDPLPLEAQLGAVVAIYFFATWCPNCEKELPFVLDLQRRYEPLGVRFVGVINKSKGQTPDVVRAHLVEKRIPFTVMQDNGGTSNTYKVETIPMLALVDRFGNLRWIDNPSSLAESTLERIVNEGLEPPPKK